MDELEKQVVEWHKATFPDATHNDIARKFEEEDREFNTAAMAMLSYFSDDSIEEFADMCIVYMAGLNRLGLPSLSETIKRKLEINKKRHWKKDGTRDK